MHEKVTGEFYEVGFLLIFVRVLEMKHGSLGFITGAADLSFWPKDGFCISITISFLLYPFMSKSMLSVAGA